MNGFSVPTVASEVRAFCCLLEHGFTFIDLKDPVQPGDVANFYSTVTVTNEGALYATKGKATCTTRGAP